MSYASRSLVLVRKLWSFSRFCLATPFSSPFSANRFYIRHVPFTSDVSSKLNRPSVVSGLVSLLRPAAFDPEGHKRYTYNTSCKLVK